MVGLVFLQTVHYDFVNYDDDKYVYQNPPVVHGLSVQGTIWALTNRAVYWGPATWLSLMLDSQLFGQNAGGYHLTNVLLHAATAVLLFLVLCRMTGRVWASALATMLFAVHPLRVESVAWVTERKDVLSGLFFALTLGAYLGYVRHPFSFFRYLAVMIFFALGLMAKASVVTLPALLLLLDYWPLRRLADHPLLKTPSQTPPHGNGGGSLNDANVGAHSSAVVLRRFTFPWGLLIEKLPLLALVAGSCAATVWSQREALGSAELFPLPWRIGNALLSYVTYLGQFFYPVGLATVYPRPGPHLPLPLANVCVALGLLLAVTAGTFFARRKFPYLLVGWLWYLGMLLPMIGLVQFGAQTLADRFTYLPQIGLCIALAWSVADACRFSRHRRWVGGLISALLLAILMGTAWRQTSFWQNSESMWTHTLACTSGNALAHYDLGLALATQGRPDEALVQYRKALAINPDYANAQTNIAIIFLARGRSREATALFRSAVKIDPGNADLHNNLAYGLACQGRFAEAIPEYQKTLELDPRCAVAHSKYGTILARQGRLDEAIAHYRLAVTIDPGNTDLHNNLAYGLACQGRFAEAIPEYQKALELDPRCAVAHSKYGTILVRQGRFAEAMAHYRSALTVQPDDIEARYHLAWLLATCPVPSLRNGAEAIEHARRVDHVCGSQPGTLDCLAAAYAEAGRFPEAIATARRALALAVKQNNRTLASSLPARIAQYEAGKPFHQTGAPLHGPKTK
jgi:Flp pilus assembly protein TadD